MTEVVRVLSLGAGVQSSALLLAYLDGVLANPPAFAVFADTQVEPKKVYVWLERLQARAGDRIPIVVATRGNMIDDYLDRKRFAAIPFFIENHDGSEGMGRRQCTREYKIDVIHKAIRERLGYRPRQLMRHKVETLLGISTDEASRMKDSRIPWQVNRFPLIEELSWSRADCIDFVRGTGLGTPPKSACYVCPYRSNESWKQLKRDEPEAFARAVEFEKVVQTRKAEMHFRGTPFLHSRRQPLASIDFDALAPDQRELFENECEGMCGV